MLKEDLKGICCPKYEQSCCEMMTKHIFRFYVCSSYHVGKTKLVFIPEGTKSMAKCTEKILERHVKQISSTFMKGKYWIFQQDGARI